MDSDNLQSGKGDDFVVALNAAGIQAGDGQFIRLSLQSFNCYRNWYMVNTNNNHFRFYINGATTQYDFYIAPKNYKTIGEVSLAFFTAFTAALATATGGTSVASNVLPSTSELMDDTSDRIWSATITNSVDTTGIVIQACQIDGDGHALAGVDRILGLTPDTTSQSFNVTRNSATSYTITGKYPGQRSTEEHVYLRSDCINNNIEMAALSAGITPANVSSILSSDVLAKIPIDYEFCNYNTSTGTEFMLNVPNRAINQLHFYLSDSKGRTVGRMFGNSATTGGSLQNTLGNMNVSFVIKVEIVHAFTPNKLQSQPPPVPNSSVAKKAGVLEYMNYGVGSY